MNGILTNYSFNASTKQITLTDVTTVDVKRVRFIKNLTTNQFIYNFVDTSTNTITASTNIITFSTSNVGMSNTDKLSIQYDLVKALDSGNVYLSGNNYTQSVGNNSSSQLTAGSTFTGTIESALNAQNAIISLRCDQACTLTIQQFSDLAGTIQFPNITYTLTANQGFNQPITVSGSYYRVLVQNTSGSSTTNLFLETWLGILPVVPNLTNLGNIPSAINEVSGTSLTLGQKDPSLSIPVTTPNDLYFIGQSGLTGTVNNIIPTTTSTDGTDLTGYLSASVQIVCPTGTYTTGQIIFEGCNDSPLSTGKWVAIPIFNQILLTGTPTSTAITLASNTSIIYTFPINFRYFRVRISTGITGASASVQAFSKFSKSAWTPAIFQVAQSNGNSLVTNAGIISIIGNATCADATANPTGVGIRTFSHNYNGSTWDRPYNNTEVTLLASAARTTTQTSADIVNYNFKKLTVVLDMTVVGTGSVTVSINGKDSASGKYYNILTGAAITTNSTNRYRVGENLAAVANSIAQDYLPRVIQIVVTANNANTATYSVGYNFGV